MTDDPTDIANADAHQVRASSFRQALCDHRVKLLAADERIAALTKAVTACADATMLYASGRDGGLYFGHSDVRDALSDALKNMRAELASLIVDRSLMGKG